MTPTRRPSFDLLSAVMAFGVVAAIAALAYPAFRDNPTSAPGLVLILTVGMIALIGLFGFRRAANAKPSIDAAIEELGADYTEEEIRLVRIKFMCEQGN